MLSGDLRDANCIEELRELGLRFHFDLLQSSPLPERPCRRSDVAGSPSANPHRGIHFSIMRPSMDATRQYPTQVECDCTRCGRPFGPYTLEPRRTAGFWPIDHRDDGFGRVLGINFYLGGRSTAKGSAYRLRSARRVVRGRRLPSGQVQVRPQREARPREARRGAVRPRRQPTPSRRRALRLSDQSPKPCRLRLPLGREDVRVARGHRRGAVAELARRLEQREPGPR